MAGVMVALGAQAALYLTLRRIAVATMPAWAHHLVHHHPAAVGTASAVVGVALVAGPAVAGPAEPPIALPLPTLQPVPLVPLPPPALPGGFDPP